MRKQNHLLIFLLLSIIFSSSCSKDDLHGPPPPYQAVPPSTVTPTPASSTPPPPVGIRNMINAQLTAFGNLSQKRSDIAVASAGNKILFAGGSISYDVFSSRVDIFNIATSSWSTAELSQPRTRIATAVLNGNIYFAGGYAGTAVTGFSSRIDIYNTETNTWSIANLGEISALMSGASAGNKVAFASGRIAHIYDASTNAWGRAVLSERPGEGYCCAGGVGGIAATAIGDVIYFAGGEGWDVHKAIDIYNTATNQWSTSSLDEYKGFAAAIAVGNTNYWAGGYTYSPNGDNLSRQVEIRNMVSGSSTFGSLFQGNKSFSAVRRNDTIIFFTGSGAIKNKFDVYDINSNTWSIGVLPEDIEEAGIISVNNTVYVAGGKVNGSLSDQIRKLEI
jgi:hypothetical protein